MTTQSAPPAYRPVRLTPLEARVLVVLRAHALARKQPPSTREIGVVVGSNYGVIQAAIVQLASKGYVSCTAGKQRAVRLVLGLYMGR